MLNKNRISSIFFLLSTVLLFYSMWFKVPFTPELMTISWSLLAVSRAFIMFPTLKTTRADIKVGEEIKQ